MKKIVLPALLLGLVLIAGCIQRETGVLQGHVKIGLYVLLSHAAYLPTRWKRLTTFEKSSFTTQTGSQCLKK
ncbi:MAG: hypothetical protein O8C63_13715 [Candidatus Methanoperedens sp.]|nr:hypothetical protein [Candidatus Methanoperedens sp.]